MEQQTTVKADSTIVIIPAASSPRPQVLALSSRIKSAAMVPVSGKPVLGWILDHLIEQGFERFLVLSIFGDDQLDHYCAARYKGKAKFSLVAVEAEGAPRGVGHSIYRGLLVSPDLKGDDAPENVLIVLGHTIYRGEFKQTPELSSDWIMVGDVQEEATRWCYAEADEEGRLVRLIDKPTSPAEHRALPALIGVYHLSSRVHLMNCLEDADNNNLAEALKLYNDNRRIKVVRVNQEHWLDCGSIVGMQKTRKALITTRARASNSIDLDEKIGTLTKRTSKSVEIFQQYLWYVGAPREIKPITPRIHDFKPADASSSQSKITMEYYAYSTLEEAWMYKELPFDVWESVMNHLIEILSKFHEFPAHLEPDDFHAMYQAKTKKRLEKLRSQAAPDGYPTWDELLDKEKLFINGRQVLGWSRMEETVWRACGDLYHENHVCLIHGDFHLGNILYDLNTRLVKLIDPRGNFGSSTMYGDLKYDLAKLRHSICGGYNYVVNDLFTVETTGISGDIRINLDRPHLLNAGVKRLSVQQKVAQLLDTKIEQLGAELSSPTLLTQVKLIEGLLFLSMLPIHYDSPHRQLAMFSIAIERFDELFNTLIDGKSAT
ncbi:MAG TPA: phosphotransferase [Pyrinomonadaceae bacterium]|nr:phosphotransferase [Pyrinomonadaceae bacterium]